MTQLQIFWAVYLTICLLYLRYVWRIKSRRHAVLTKGISTRARVVELHVFRGDEGPDLLTPEVCFKATDGRRYQVKLDSTCDANRYRMGQEVAIRYEAAHPTNVIRADDRWMDVWVHAVLCASLMGFGVFLHFKVEYERGRLLNTASATAKITH